MNYFYSIVERENIIFKNCYINDNTKGICLKLPNNKTAIILDNNKIENTIEEKCILAEELGHYYCDALYSPFCYDSSLISRNEYRAKKWAFKTLIQPNVLIKYRDLSKYEIAEEIGITEDMLDMAYNYYRQNEVI